MKISNVKIYITERDLCEIAQETIEKYIKIQGLVISKILIGDNINISGIYKNKIKIPFDVSISIEEVINNKLILRIERIYVKKIKVINSLTMLAINSSIKQFKHLGIDNYDNIVKVDFYKICPIIPMVDFILEDLKLIPFGLEAIVSNLNILDKTQIDNVKVIEDSINSDENLNEKNIEYNYKVKKDNKNYTYNTFRAEFKNKFPQKYKDMYDYVVLIPDIISLFLNLFRDKRVAKEVKFNIYIALAYLLCPLDVIPDIIPFIGKIDDLAVTFFMLQKILCDIPEEVILDNWKGKENIIIISKEAATFLGDKFGVGEIKKVVNILRKTLIKTYKFFVD